MLMGIMWMMTALVVGFMAGRISMYGLWDTDEGETEEGRDSRQAESGKQGRRRRDRSQEDGRPSWSLASPVTGEVLLQKEGEHPTMVIHPHSDRLYAPADGKVSRLYPMGSAFLFTTEFGAEIYIQAGCGEDDLLARFYRPRVLQNEVVEKGKLLLEFESQTGVANAIMATHETNPCEELMKGCTHLSTPPEPGHPAGAAHTVSGCMSEGTHSHTTDVFP